jgi:hypothetical protein
MAVPPDDAAGSDDSELGTLLADVARALGTGQGAVDAERIVRLAASAVPHADHTGLSLVVGTRPPTSLASSGPVPAQVDALQHRLEEGPCLSAIAHDELIYVEDFSVDRRWPRFAEAVTMVAPVRALFAVRMALGGQRGAALNFYAERPGAFVDADFAAGTVLAGLAAAALERDVVRDEVANLEVALDSARTIGTAIGILMARQLVTREQAFAQLRVASQHLKRKLRDVAEQVTETGDLPDG